MLTLVSDTFSQIQNRLHMSTDSSCCNIPCIDTHGTASWSNTCALTSAHCNDMCFRPYTKPASLVSIGPDLHLKLYIIHCYLNRPNCIDICDELYLCIWLCFSPFSGSHAVAQKPALFILPCLTTGFNHRCLCLLSTANSDPRLRASRVYKTASLYFRSTVTSLSKYARSEPQTP